MRLTRPGARVTNITEERTEVLRSQSASDQAFSGLVHGGADTLSCDNRQVGGPDGPVPKFDRARQDVVANPAREPQAGAAAPALRHHDDRRCALVPRPDRDPRPRWFE